MDYTLNDIVTGAKTLAKTFGNKKDKYNLSFTKEKDNCWYIDFPNWPFDHHNLMMVAGADDLCEIFSYDGNHTEVEVDLSNNNPTSEEILATRIEHALTGGATYEIEVDSKKVHFWLCPVTLFVFGKYPKYIKFKPLKINKEDINKRIDSEMTNSDKLLEEYLEANKNKTDCDIEDIIKDSDFLLQLWKKEEQV